MGELAEKLLGTGKELKELSELLAKKKYVDESMLKDLEQLYGSFASLIAKLQVRGLTDEEVLEVILQLKQGK